MSDFKYPMTSSDFLTNGIQTINWNTSKRHQM